MKIPMKADYRSTSYYAHSKKAVISEVTVNDASDIGSWAVRKHSEIVGDVPLDSRGGDYGTATAEIRDGRKVVRLTSPVDCEEQNSDKGRGWGLSTLFCDCGEKDLGEYNRIAFDVYPELPGFRVVCLCIYLYNGGEHVMPQDMARDGLHFVILENNKWNTVYWEIPELPRDKVRGLGLQYRMQGSEPGACTEVKFDFTNVRFQKVDADHTRGWEPKNGEIVFSHTGYTPSGKKTAIAKGLTSPTFTLIRSSDGLPLYEGSIETKAFHTGEYQLLDFSDFSEEGRFFIKAGEKLTRPFDISANLWKGTIEKTLNFFYAERCGFPIPGVHDICHSDLCASHNGLKKVMNGGWHDAGDLSQGLGNTADAAYSMMSLALKYKDSDKALYEELIDEARWGQDWVLKTRFPDGYRATWLTMDFWTQGYLGDYDDITYETNRSAGSNLLGASVEALAARVYAEIDPPFALRNLKAALEDYAYAVEDLEKPSDFGMRFDPLGSAAQAVIASLELYKTTGEVIYLDNAEKYAEVIPLCQVTEYPDWDIPLRGYFCSDKEHKRTVHSSHSSREQLPLIALCELNALRPDKKWTDCLALFAEYVKAVTKFTAPYHMLPASVYNIDEVENPRGRGGPFGCPPEHAAAQIKNGIKLSEKNYLRLFPVWYSFRGNSGVTLSLALGILAAANTLGDDELREIVNETLQWHVGRNPFNQSLIWGEGYNYTPQYSAMSGDIVGSFPVGVEARNDEDIPYYPHANCYNYKEVWVMPAARWLALMSRL